MLAQKIQKFMSQPFHVAETFTGISGVYVEISDTVKSFKSIIGGEVDDIPEKLFYMAGSIDEVKIRYRK